MLRTQPSSADSFRITRIYSTQCTTTQHWQSGWVWGKLELLGKSICKQCFNLKCCIFSNKNTRQNNSIFPNSSFKNSLIVLACWTVFILSRELKELVIKQWLQGWWVFLLGRTRSTCSKNWRKDQGEEDNGYCACFILHPTLFLGILSNYLWSVCTV